MEMMSFKDIQDYGLVCSVPFFIAALYLYTKFRFRKLPDSHRDLPSIKCETKNTPKLKKPYISPQMSRRRNFRAKIEDPVPNEHKPMFESSSPMKHFLSPDESLDQDDHDLIWRNEKLIAESLNELKNEKTSENNSQENNSQEDYANDKEDEEVKARDKPGNRIVAWIEDDKKNLMDPLQENSDLGLSEIERNQRLENLIARRRARKFLMAIRGQAGLLYENELETANKMAPVKTNNFASSDEDPAPGSAPSVLLPTRNPFDIPYDPTEEKPNLTVDGFQQEFLGPHQMSRHESFTRGKSFEIDRDRDSMRPAQRRYMDRVVKRESRFAQLRRQPVQGDRGSFIEQFLQQQQDDPDEDESRSSANKEEQEPALTGQPKDTENTSDDQLDARKSQEAPSSSNAVENQTQQQEQEISSSSDKLLEDKSSVSVGNIEDEGGVLASQCRSNEECRDRRQRSCESLDQVVDNPGEEEEEGSIFFVDNSNSMPPLSPEQAAKDSRPTLLDNPEEIDNQQPPIQDESDTRNIQDNEINNQTGQDIISDTQKYDDEENINPFANSVEEADVIETNNLINANGDEKSDDIKEESPVEQLKSEPLDILESRGGESQESRAESRAPPNEQLISEPIDQGDDEQVNTKPVEGSIGEESQAPLEEEAKSGLV